MAFGILAALVGSLCSSEEGVEGITEPENDVQLSVAVDGLVSEILVKEGQVVKKGDILLCLDARLEKNETEKRLMIWKDTAQLQAQTRNRDIVASILSKTRELFQKNRSVSEDEVSKVEIEHSRLVGEVLTLEAGEQKEKLDYESSLIELSRRTLIAPIDGVVTKVSLQCGEWARPTLEVVHLVDISRCRVEMSLEDRIARQLDAQTPATVLVKADDKEIRKVGLVSFISPVADQASGLIRVVVSFDNQDLLVRAGLQARVIFGPNK